MIYTVAVSLSGGITDYTVDADYFSIEKGTPTAHFYRRDPSDPCINGDTEVAVFTHALCITVQDVVDRTDPALGVSVIMEALGKKLRKLTDKTGMPLWEPGMSINGPDYFLDEPVTWK